MSKSKDSSSKLHEKHQTILAQLLRDEDNKYCADCMVKGARWASWNLGVFMCIRCAGIHRNLGVHISRVKSVNLDSWTPEQIESIQKKGNGYAKSKYEANLPANFRRPQDDYAVEQFIRAKYERKLYLSKDTDAQPKPAVTKEAPDSKAKNKPKKTSNSLSTQKSSRSDQVVSVPRPATVRHSPSPQPVKPTPSASKTTGSSLISLESEAPPSTKKGAAQPVVDILTGLTPSSTTLSSNASNSSSSPNFLMSSQPVGNQPLIGMPTQTSPPTGSVPPSNGVSAKDSIMSLYGAAQQPQLSSYSAQGYPINAMYYQQQQSAAMQMAHMAAVQQHQVNQVTTQMQQIRMTQQPPQHTPPQFPNSMNNGGVPVMGMGGQTLNPTLW